MKIYTIHNIKQWPMAAQRTIPPLWIDVAIVAAIGLLIWGVM